MQKKSLTFIGPFLFGRDYKNNRMFAVRSCKLTYNRLTLWLGVEPMRIGTDTRWIRFV